MPPPRQRKHVNASPPVQLVGPQPVAGLILYVVVFYSELVGRWRRFRKAFSEWCNNDIDIAQYKTSLGVPQKVLVDEAWESELCIVVALTAFSLYITYLMPLNYLDLLHR
ncbi:hypothetical protein ANCDUO_14232 [Ancylostoma duodenale]|uniref:Uncharacterized protein n=1 Tax=Ancylostoma duodenale TaxID=51022 RepID=A0A0C2G3S5_9BILA|nr:hypothetical protein ANCDUO_14232 [Ancylostoma duodenale]